ncbi:hypothetical protein SB02110_00062 [Klebsiella quasipneumoniae subsp. quasipneumoniae]|nr:hypothetical protein SB02110_00062 [Klebsiella quasipneumoniae subsp. quasipneumoniae]
MTMITENGTDQLSYSAARHRNTTRIEMAYRLIAWPLASFSCSEMPLHAQVEPAGRLSASFSILSIAAPELKPAAFSPWISKAAEPL